MKGSDFLNILSYILKIGIGLFILLLVISSLNVPVNEEYFTNNTTSTSTTSSTSTSTSTPSTTSPLFSSDVQSTTDSNCNLETTTVKDDQYFKTTITPCLDTYDDPDPNPVFLDSTCASIDTPSHVGTLLPKFHFEEM